MRVTHINPQTPPSPLQYKYLLNTQLESHISIIPTTFPPCVNWLRHTSLSFHNLPPLALSGYYPSGGTRGTRSQQFFFPLLLTVAVSERQFTSTYPLFNVRFSFAILYYSYVGKEQTSEKEKKKIFFGLDQIPLVHPEG